MVKFRFFIPGNIPGKARPIVTKNNTYMPKAYTDFKKKAKSYIPKIDKPLVTPVSITIFLVGSHGSDGDNIIGTIDDLVIEEKLLITTDGKKGDDSSKQIPEIIFRRYEHDKIKFCLVTITEIKPFTIRKFMIDVKAMGFAAFKLIEHFFDKTK